MSHAEIDDLAGLALDHDDVSADVQQHVESCPQCAEAVAAFAAARALAGGGPLIAPAQHVRDQVMTQVRRSAPVAAPVPAPVPAPVAAPIPATVSTVPADPIPLPVAREVLPPVPARRGVSPWLAGIAAVLALLAGLGLGRLTGGTAPAPEATDPDPGTVVAAADLTALDSDAARGVASAVEKDDTLTLRVSAEGLDDSDGVHEVWLINTDGKRMVAIGFLASGDKGQFDVPLGLIEQGYRIVDISVEPDDGDPTHSGVSLARGELA